MYARQEDGEGRLDVIVIIIAGWARERSTSSLKIASSLALCSELLLGVSRPWRFLICPNAVRCHPLSLSSETLSTPLPGSTKQTSLLHSPPPRLASPHSSHTLGSVFASDAGSSTESSSFAAWARQSPRALRLPGERSEDQENKLSTQAQLYRTHHRCAGIGTGNASRAVRRRSGALD
jgi:hypothetical protein